MSSLSRELVFLILQFLDEEKFKDTVHRSLSKPKGSNFFVLNCSLVGTSVVLSGVLLKL